MSALTTEPTRLVYIDTEFGNLIPDRGDLFEVAWAVNDGPVRSHPFLHTLEGADSMALQVNRYHERTDLHRFCTDHLLQTSVPGPRPEWYRDLLRDLTGATIVAENYGIDWIKLYRKLGYEPWHYRKIELSSVAMTVFDLDRPESQTKTVDRLNDLGFDIPHGDHSAAADVESLRACYHALRILRARHGYPAPVES